MNDVHKLDFKFDVKKLNESLDWILEQADIDRDLLLSNSNLFTASIIFLSNLSISAPIDLVNSQYGSAAIKILSSTF